MKTSDYSSFNPPRLPHDPTPAKALRLAFWLAGAFVTGAFLPHASAQPVSPAVTNLWRIPPGQEDDFPAAADNNVRGVAINPVNGNVIYASRAGGSNHLAVVDGDTGIVLRRLSGEGVSGGTLALISVKVADDGVIYAANLAAASGFLKIYRWDSDSTPDDPLVVFGFSPVSTRYGDTMDLRGGGVNTEIIMSGTGGDKFALFTTTDGTNFNGHATASDTMVEFPLPTGLAAGDLGKGIAFDGSNDALYGKRDGTTPVRYVTFNRGAGTSTLVTNITTELRLVGLDVAVTNGFKIVAGVLYGSGTTLLVDQHRVSFWNITNPSDPQKIGDDPMPGPYFANGNAIGAADAQNGRIAVCEPNNVIALYQLYLITNPPPTILVEPVGNTNILTGGFYSLSINASGAGLAYQWYKDGNAVSAATNAALHLTNLVASQAGDYRVIVTNAGGSATSSVATIGLLPSTLTSVAAKLWQRPPGSLSFLTVDNAQRGLAYHALSNQVLVVSRTGGANVHCLDANTGNAVTNLAMTGVGGQTGEALPINMIGVADDGAIYVCNLTLNGSAFTIYRWADASPETVATLAYGPDAPVFERIGDTFAVQGAGVDTRLIAATRNGTAVVVFTTSDGVNFVPNVVDVTVAPASFAGLGLAAGGDNSFWATSPTFLLHKVVYDLVNATNDVLVALGGQSGYNIGADNQNQLIASIGTADTPSNLRLLDVYQQAANAPLLDQEFFGSDNPNVNGTGAVAVDVAGGRIFALDTNNGLLAVKYAPPIRFTSSGSNLNMTWYGPAVLQHAPAVTGTYTNVPAAPSPHTTSQPGYYRLTH